MSEELKPCPVPWCKAVEVEITHPNRLYFAECQKCGCIGPACETAEKAGEEWNIRPTDAVPTVGEVDSELESALCAPTWAISLTHVHNAIAALRTMKGEAK